DAAAAPPDVARAYAGGKLPAFDAKRRDLVGELATAFAAGREIDPVKLDRLKQMAAVRAALAGDAAAVEQALKRADVLARWVDWAVDPADLQTIAGGYRQALSAQVEGYATDATPAKPWAEVRDRYAPFVRLVGRQAAYADACAALPAGLAGHVGRLTTALDGQPFAAERHAAFALALWARYEQSGDAKAVAAVVEAMGKRGEKK
ncbi:MAG: hypothetical protein JWO31_4269, partial [Phycisphaerales bacterium]|nr:hypothetical protein [Phycisphaerales bacterium]